MVSGSCRPVLALERLLSHHGGRDTARTVARLRHHGVEKIRPGLGGQVSRRSIALSSPQMQAKMTPAEVTKMLRANEFTQKISSFSPVKSFDTNTLDSNTPSEDSHAEAFVNHNEGMLFGIFDGHGGASCGQVVAKRLFDYISAALLPPQELTDHLNALTSEDKTDPNRHLVKRFNDKFELVEDLNELYRQSYIKYVKELKKKQSELDATENFHNVEQILIDSFDRLDLDMSTEATEAPKLPRHYIPTEADYKAFKPVTVAMSGCVAAAAYISGHHLTVAGTGDVTAVVGYLSDTDTWMAKKLTNEHNSDNNKEVKRILSEHPEPEHHHIIKGDRLLSILAPLRAFGDFKFKWSVETVNQVLGAILGEHACPPNYKTPPYLTATPEVMYHRLTPRDKFLVIGSDGLWDQMTPMQVVRLVGEHINGKSVLRPLENLPARAKLEDIEKILKTRQNAMRSKPKDTNAATHLLRNALGGTAYGVDHLRLSQSLSLPKDMVRMFRDDITIQVVFFNEEYLRKF